MSDTATVSRSAPAAQPPVEVLWLPARQVDGQRPSLNGPLLVDGSDDDVLDGPLRLAQLLARRDRARAQVMAVVSPLPSLRSVGASLAAGLDSEEVDECRREVARNRVRARVSEHVGLSVFFGTSAVLGPRVHALSVAARSDAAAYVLSGLPAPGASGREGRGRLASRLAVEAATPVLAVPPNVQALPRSVLAAIDGGDASMDAARAALPLMGEFGSLTLLHVAPSDSLAGGRSPATDRQNRVMHALRSLAKELGTGADVAVHLVVLQGDPQAVFAEWVSGFDLVTLGASSHETNELASGASTSRVVFENAPGAILVAPAVRMHVEPASSRRHVVAAEPGLRGT